jgi:hypothetical protein
MITPPGRLRQGTVRPEFPISAARLDLGSGEGIGLTRAWDWTRRIVCNRSDDWRPGYVRCAATAADRTSP